MLYFFEFFFYTSSFVSYFVNNLSYLLIVWLNITKNNIFLIINIISIFFQQFSYNFYLFFIYFFNNFSKVNNCNHININLIYGLTDIHPPLFYITLVFFFNILLLTNNNKFYLKLKIIFYIGSYTMILGGFWGLGNFTWGFFWLNDPIEVILLFIILLVILILHTYMFKSKQYKFIYILFFIFIYLISFRIGFVNTRHNFFNIKNLSNLILSYFFALFIIQKNFFKFFFFLIIFNFFKFFLFFISTFFIRFLSILSRYLMGVHIFFFSLLVIFFKYKENNISSFSLMYTHYVNILNFFFKNFIFTYTNVYSNFFFFTSFYLTSNYLYNLKITITFFNIFLSYWIYILIIFFLISTLKIVPK